MDVIKIKVSKLIEYENNPRRNDEAVDAVAESIRQCTYISPIIVDENYVILAGHTRKKALEKLGIKETEVIMKSGLTEEQKTKYRLLDNKTNELASWDFEKLEQELEGLDFEDFDFGFELHEESKEVVEDDFDDELPDVAISKRGDVWQLGNHRLMCGDSTLAEDVETLMDGEKADMLLTDPPYNVNYEGKTKDALKIQNDSMEDSAFREFLKDAFSCADAVMKAGAVFYIWHADSEGYNFRGACHDIGWKVRQCIIWNKNSMVMGRQDYQWKHEPCLYGWKDGAGHLWASDRKQTTVLDFQRPNKADIHPTMKPIALFDYQIKNNTKGLDIVLDLFDGSGTTIMACEQNGRKARCMELDPKYVDAAIKRWEKFTGQKAVLVNG